MKQIDLTKGYVTTVDDDTYEMLMEYKWCAGRKGGSYYAVSRTNGKLISMHRLLMGFPDGLCIDHIDQNSLNNTLSNLRTATKAQNGMNRGPQKNTKTGFKGVSYDKSRNKYKATIVLDYKQKLIGRYDTPEEAAHAYDGAVDEFHGSYGYRNFK